jgi:hypothetical protein
MAIVGAVLQVPHSTPFIGARSAGRRGRGSPSELVHPRDGNAVGGRPRGSGDSHVDSVDTRTHARRRTRPGCCINPQDREKPNGKPWADCHAPPRIPQGHMLGRRGRGTTSDFVRSGADSTGTVGTQRQAATQAPAGGEAHPGRQTTTTPRSFMFPRFFSGMTLRCASVGRCRGTQCSTVGSGSASLPRPRRRRQCSTAFWNERPPGQGRQASCRFG